MRVGVGSGEGHGDGWKWREVWRDTNGACMKGVCCDYKTRSN